MEVIGTHDNDPEYQSRIDRFRSTSFPERAPAILFDLDGTLASDAHRKRYVEDLKPAQWPLYMELQQLDPVIQSTELLLRWHEAHGYAIVLLSLRWGWEPFGSLCRNWLSDKNIPYDDLFLRPKELHSSGAHAKSQIFVESIAPKYDVKLAFDDRDDILAMWSALGVPIHKVTDPYLAE